MEEAQRKARENLASLASEYRNQLAVAGCMALEVLEINKKEEIERIQNIAAQRASKIKKTIEDAAQMPDAKIVRKHWGGVSGDHFFGDQVKVS